jgi:hypothetical protein
MIQTERDRGGKPIGFFGETGRSAALKRRILSWGVAGRIRELLSREHLASPGDGISFGTPVPGFLSTLIR